MHSLTVTNVHNWMNHLGIEAHRKSNHLDTQEKKGNINNRHAIINVIKIFSKNQILLQKLGAYTVVYRFAQTFEHHMMK